MSSLINARKDKAVQAVSRSTRPTSLAQSRQHASVAEILHRPAMLDPVIDSTLNQSMPHSTKRLTAVGQTTSSDAVTRGMPADTYGSPLLRGNKVRESLAKGKKAADRVICSAKQGIWTKTVKPAEWTQDGQFLWNVTLHSACRPGWIVQEIINERWKAYKANGESVPSPAHPHYWEAWYVTSTGRVNPSKSGYNDSWYNENLKSKTDAVKGHWSTRGKLYFSSKRSTIAHFKYGNPVKDLPSTTTRPSNLGAVLMLRAAYGDWNSSVSPPIHHGAAGPQ